MVTEHVLEGYAHVMCHASAKWPNLMLGYKLLPPSFSGFITCRAGELFLPVGRKVTVATDANTSYFRKTVQSSKTVRKSQTFIDKFYQVIRKLEITYQL